MNNITYTHKITATIPILICKDAIRHIQGTLTKVASSHNPPTPVTSTTARTTPNTSQSTSKSTTQNNENNASGQDPGNFVLYAILLLVLFVNTSIEM